MTEQDQQNYEKLLKHWNEQRKQFNEWKAANSRQSGTEQYVDYCKNFEQWEKDIKRHIADYEAKLRRPTAGPAGPESILDDLLKRVDEMQFLMSIIQLSSQDKTFLPALLDANKKLQGQQTSLTGAPVVYTPAAIHAPSAPYAAMVTPYAIPPVFANPQVVPIPVASSSVAYAFPPPPVPMTVITASTIPHYSAPVAANTPKPPQYSGGENVEIW